MAVGTVKWFNNRKGYGFIQPEEGGRDVFVHISALEQAGLQTLDENEKVEFQLTESRGKTVASDLKIAGGGGTAATESNDAPAEDNADAEAETEVEEEAEVAAEEEEEETQAL